ncbi:GSCOCG00003432001-RA-CDS [Cotesia congregata]|nr:GSCOCG00003432001-RA-CDS [Cotesia congregata]
MTDTTKLPLPLNPIKSSPLEERRLWVGNLDLRINEIIKINLNFFFQLVPTIENRSKIWEN